MEPRSSHDVDRAPSPAAGQAPARDAWLEYERRKRVFNARYWTATPEQREHFIQQLLRELGL